VLNTILDSFRHDQSCVQEDSFQISGRSKSS